MDKENNIKFEMSGLYKFATYQMPIIGQLVSGVLLIYFIAYGFNRGYSLKYILTGPVILFGLFIILLFIVLWKNAKAWYATSMIVNVEKKEFCAYIFSTKKEVKFVVDDIKEIYSNDQMFRFYLKNGTWISWAKDDSKEAMEDVIKSFGISIVNKIFLK
jgi:hypothetical protein